MTPIESVLQPFLSPEWEVRAEALRTLKTADLAVVEALFSQLDHPDWKQRDFLHSVWLELCRSGSPELKAHLLKTARERPDHDRAEVRRLMLQTLGVLGADADIEQLRAALASEDPLLRRTACEALGHFPAEQVIEPLIEALNDLDEAVRYLAADGLRQFETGEVVQALVAHLDDPFVRTRELICDILGQFGDVRAVPGVVNCLEDLDFRVRVHACRTLAAIGDLAAVDPLIERLNDKQKVVRFAAAEALLALGSIPAIQELAKNYSYPETPTILKQLKVQSDALTDDLETLVCTDCLTRFERHWLVADWRIYGRAIYCRSCGRVNTGRAGIQAMVMVLDNRLTEPLYRTDTELRINWLVHTQLTDFERVEIVHATDNQVEAFCVQVGNDTDDYRLQKSKTVPCHVICDLSENTIRILKNTFGEVVR